jgi:isoleucyl-tRNA synthetase
MVSVVELGRTCRERRKVGLKTPLRNVTIMNKSEKFTRDIKKLETYVLDELNCEEMTFSNSTDNISYTAVLNFKVLGKKLGKDMKAVLAASKDISQDDLAKFDSIGEITILGYSINAEEMTVTRGLKGLDDANLDVNGDAETLVVMDFTHDPDLERKRLARDVANRVQKLRKDAKLQQDDPVDMWAEGSGPGELSKVLEEKKDFLDKLLRRPLWRANQLQGHETLVKKEEFDLDGDKLVVTITMRGPFFNADEMAKLAGGNEQTQAALRQYAQSFDLQKLLTAGDELETSIDGQSYKMKRKVHFAVGPADAPWLSN